MVQILFTVFGMGYIYENAQIIDNHGTLLHTTVYTHESTNFCRIYPVSCFLYIYPFRQKIQESTIPEIVCTI